MKKKLILKIGTSTLTAGSNKISYEKIKDIARQVTILQKDYEIILISSGAIATAKQFIDIKKYDKSTSSKQALSAIGQPKLIRIYDEIFESFDLRVAQCLMTYQDFNNKAAKLNTKHTINTLLKHNYIPIINENDTVSTEEITFGDNDKLSALVAVTVGAKLLVLTSDIDGLYSKNPHLQMNTKLIEEVTDLKMVESFVQEKKSKLGTGGMTSKIQAAAICRGKNIEVWIVNGNKNNFLIDAINNKIPFTRFKV